MSNSRVSAAAVSGAVSGFVPVDMSLQVQDCASTADQLADTVRQLMLENTDLKNTVQTNNKTMKDAHELFANFERRANQERVDHAANYEQVKNIVTGLKKKIMDQEQVISSMKQKSAQPLQSSDEQNALHAQISTLTTDVYLKTSQITQMTQEREELRRSLDAARAEVNALTDTLEKTKLNVQELAADYHGQLVTIDDLQKKETEMKQDLQRMWKEKKEYAAQIDNLTAQLFSAEDTLAMKDEKIRLKDKEIEDLAVLAAQADIYKADFQAERKSREELNDKKMELEDRVRGLEEDLNLRRASSTQGAAHQDARVGNNTVPRNGDRSYGVQQQENQNWSQFVPQQRNQTVIQQATEDWVPQPVTQQQRNQQPEWVQQPVRRSDHPTSYNEPRPPPPIMDARHETAYATAGQHNPGQYGASYANINDGWQTQPNLYPNLRQSPNRQLINLREDNSSGSFPNSVGVSEAVVPEVLPRTVVQPLRHESPEHTALQTTVLSDHKCPFCNYDAPDVDSLELHINDNHPE